MNRGMELFIGRQKNMFVIWSEIYPVSTNVLTEKGVPAKPTCVKHILKVVSLS